MISKFAVKRPVTSLMIILIAIAFGTLSILNLKMDLMPNMNLPYAAVITTYSTAGSEEIEKLVTEPIEGVMGTVSGIKNITSQSQNGLSLVMIEFETSVNIDNATLDMREKIDLIKGVLPSDADEPMVIKADMNSFNPMQISISSEKEDLVSLKQLVEDKIVDRIERQDGVASVSLSGGLEKEVRVILNEERLRGYGISEAAIQQLLVAENTSSATGQIKLGDKNLSIRVKGEFQSLEEISNLPLNTATGQVIYLRDVATVEESYKENSSISYTDGIPSIALSIQKQSTANTVNVSNAVMAEIGRISREMPDVQIKTILDPAEYIKFSLSNVVDSAIYGSVLALVILYIFLRNVRSTLVIGTAIPVSIISTFALMYFSNITINMMSLGGLTLGIGMLVDNSIVVLESIYRKLEDGADKITAAIDGAREVGMAITASTLTTVAVFVPITFAGGLIAQVFNELSLTIAFSLFASLFVALTFVPMVSSVILSTDTVAHVHYTRNIFTVFMDFIGSGIEKLEAVYKKVLFACLKRKKLTIIATVIFIILTFSVFPMVGMEFMPETDEGAISVTVDLPKGSVLEETEKTAWAVLERLQDDPDIVDVSLSAGSGGGGLSAVMGGSSNSASINISLTDKQDRKRSAKEIALEMSEKVMDIPGADVTISAASRGMGSYGGSGISIDVKGDDLAVLETISNDFMEILSGMPNISNASTSLEESTPQATITINRDKCAALGISSSSVSNVIRTAVSGNVATSYKVGGTELDIRIMQSVDKVDYLNDLENILVPSARGINVPLYEIADIETETTPVTITRDNQQKYVTVTADLVDIDTNTANKAFEEKLADYIMPENYRWEYSGSSQQMLESFGSLLYALILSILLLYMIMAAQFESLIYPLIVMFSIPIAMTGGLFGLFLVGSPLSITGFLGLIMLAGIVVNNAIVLIDYANLLTRERNMTYLDAIKKAGPVRLRPILMTTLTTVLALVPMMLSNGQGAEMMKGLATVVVFGLVLSTIVTLILIPVVYAIFNVFRERWASKRDTKRGIRDKERAKKKEALNYK